MHTIRLISIIFCLLMRCGSALAEDEGLPLGQRLGAVRDHHLWPAVTDGFDARGWQILLGGAAATAIAHNQDDWVRERYEDDPKLKPKLSKFGSIWGSGGPGLVIAGALYFVDPSPAVALVEAIALTSVTHACIALLSRRGRPRNPANRTSFPSGHTANAWAVATSLSYSYGWPVAIPTFAAALATMASRVVDGRHWLSDTVFAATLGLFWGRATHFHHARPDEVRIIPIFDGDHIGIGARLTLY